MAVLGLRFCARAFSSCGERGPLFIAVHGPLTVAASLVAEHRLHPLGQGLKTPGSSLEHGIFMGPLSLHQLTLGTHGGMFFPRENSFHTSQGLFSLYFTHDKGHHVPQEHLSESGMVSFCSRALGVPDRKSTRLNSSH